MICILKTSIPAIGEWELAAIESGAAILVGETDAPDWFCSHCVPGWLEVYVLAMREYDVQVQQEKAIEAQDFEEAGRRRDVKLKIRRDREVAFAKVMGRMELD